MELPLGAGLDAATVRWMTVTGPTAAFCLLGAADLLGTTNLVSWTQLNGPSATLEALAVDLALHPIGLFAAGSDGAWVSRDLGASWAATTGLPNQPSANLSRLSITAPLAEQSIWARGMVSMESAAAMKWITRERPRIDRVACAWLIKGFIDPRPEFLFVPGIRCWSAPSRSTPPRFTCEAASSDERPEKPVWTC